MRRPNLLIMPLIAVASAGLVLSACSPGGEEQATVAPPLAEVDLSTGRSLDNLDEPATVLFKSDPADQTGQMTTTTTTTDPGGTMITEPGETPPDPGDSDVTHPSVTVGTIGPVATAGPNDPPSMPEGPVVTAGPIGPVATAETTNPAGGEQADYDLLVFPIHAVVSQGCRDQGDFPRIFQSGNPAIVLDTFDNSPLQTSVFSENVWVEILGGPTDPQIELGSGQTALTTLLQASADGAAGHQVVLSVYGFVSGGIEIRWSEQTGGFGQLISPKFYPLNDNSSPCWVQLNTAVIKTS